MERKKGLPSSASFFVNRQTGWRSSLQTPPCSSIQTKKGERQQKRENFREKATLQWVENSCYNKDSIIIIALQAKRRMIAGWSSNQKDGEKW